MSEATILAILFTSVWVLTFWPAWRLLMKLIAMSSSGRSARTFWLWLLLYRVIIAAPYIVLLFFGADTLPTIIKGIIVGFVVTSFTIRAC